MTNIQSRLSLVAALLFAAVCSTSVARANFFLPGPPPKLPYTEAARLALDHAAKHRNNGNTFYVLQVWIDHLPGESKPCWIVLLASSTEGYYRAAVYMDGRIRAPIKGLLYPRAP